MNREWGESDYSQSTSAVEVGRLPSPRFVYAAAARALGLAAFFRSAQRLFIISDNLLRPAAVRPFRLFGAVVVEPFGLPGDLRPVLGVF